ncbi:unnamed protein product, partial [Ectocarpus sp. 12 AP-2014]
MSSNQDNNHGINGPSSGHSSSLILRKNCDRCTVKKIKCSAPFGSNRPCESCEKYAVECVFSGRRKPGPVPKRAEGAPAPPRVR